MSVDYGGCSLGSIVYWPFYECFSGGPTLLGVRLKLSGSAYSPAETGPDDGSVAVIPWSPVDDTTAITWTISDIFVRAETPGSTQTLVRVEYSTGPGNFSPVGDIDADPGVSLGAGVNQSSRPATLQVTQAPSGWKVRTNVTELGTGMSGLSVYLVLTANI